MKLEEKQADRRVSIMIKLYSNGNFHKANSFMERLLELGKLGVLDKYGQRGVDALREATPKNTGKTADSWSYSIERQKGQVRIVWSNSNTNSSWAGNEVNIAVILQYGHATGNGGYVQGIDYINPALKPVFDEIADKSWKELLKG